jgi:carbon storage regulator CsrA
MLALGRRANESIHIRDDIILTVLQIRRAEGDVRFSLKAPSDERSVQLELDGKEHTVKAAGVAFTVKSMQEIVIDGNVVVVVVSISKSQIRMSFDAPKSVAIKRSELD